MAPYQQSSCVYCRENLPHARHVTPLQYAQMFADMETYAKLHKPSVLVQSDNQPVRKSA
jgi:hypothetical protein